MEHALLMARSLTRGQRMWRRLYNSGIRSDLRKAPTGLTGQGCNYVLQVSRQQLNDVLRILRGSDLAPQTVWVWEENGYREWME